ncbi:MAG: sulfatase-like hydrolase/transferase [Lachnospiraceae bacterium]|nr:sulfatase-like hydrolase/transferase [Lachnospiraceae bacterium]
MSAGLMLAASLRAGSAYSAFFGFLELAVIFCTGQTLYETRRRTGYVLTTLFCLIYNLQYVSLMFAGSFLSRLMLENTASLSVLGDRFFLYGAVILIAVTGACLPMASWPEGRFHPGLRPAALALTVELAACLILTSRYSPVFQLGVLGHDCYQHYELRRQIARQGGEAAAADGNALADAAAFDGETALTVEASELRDGASDDGSGIRRSEDMGASGPGTAASPTGESAADRPAPTASSREDFYRSGIPGCRDKDDALPEDPNIILIVTEGLSQSIVEDERNIMPYVRRYEAMSVNFSSYYNHTFATYRALPGQLYSGYQMDNLDSHGLISLTDILRDRGYSTLFISPEPGNAEFSDYIAGCGFEEAINARGNIPAGRADYSDGEAYELLWDTVCAQAEEDSPFFTMIYTVNTHVGKNKTETRYSDSSSAYINKFYDCDQQFGEFMARFEASSLAKDTIIVFTADHAAYVEAEFSANFPETERICRSVDRIPFFIYYPGVTPETISAGGRNSLDMAPTLCDYLDISAENYFLGRSLFFDYPRNPSVETMSFDGGKFCETDRGVMRVLAGGSDDERTGLIYRYLGIAGRY